jgi:hypothetical protein
MDAESDGRALRWMIAAGSLGLSLVDFGEGDEANLATARVQGDLRTRVLESRRAYFSEMLATIVVSAYNRAVRLGLTEGEIAEVGDLRITTGDAAPADNSDMGQGAAAVANALETVSAQGLAGDSWLRLVLRTVADYAGATLSDETLETILAESKEAAAEAERKGVSA